MDRRWLVGVMVLGGCVASDGGDSDANLMSASATDATDSATGNVDPTVGESSGESGDYGGNCVETPSVVGDGATVGITGRTADEIIADVAGTYAGSITWSAEGPVAYQGSSAPTPMTLMLTYDGGEIRNIDAMLVHACEHDGPCPCEDSFEIDVTWRLVSDDGVLDESWVAPVLHQPGSFFMSSALGIHHDFQPDDTTGSLSAASFQLDGDTVLEKLVASADLGGGAAQGSINAQVAAMGWVGYGSIAGFAAVREVNETSCAEIDGAESCAAVGCAPVDGQRIYGVAPQCDCSPTETFCFATAPADNAPKQLYTRVYADQYEEYDEVVALPTLTEPVPASWRACTDAPEVDACACFPDVEPC